MLRVRNEAPLMQHFFELGPIDCVVLTGSVTYERRSTVGISAADTTRLTVDLDDRSDIEVEGAHVSALRDEVHLWL